MQMPIKPEALSAQQPLSVSYKAPLPPSLESVLLQMADPVLICEPDWTIRNANEPMAAILGRQSAHLTGLPVQDICRISFLHTSFFSVQQKLKQDGSWAGELYLDPGEGYAQHFSAAYHLLSLPALSEPRILIILQGDQKKENHREDLFRMENKYRTVVDSLSEGVILIRPDGTIETSNQKAASILGIPVETLNGLPLVSPEWNAIRRDGTVFPIEDFPAIVSLRTGVEMNDVVMGLRKPDGSELWISINSRPIFRDNPFRPDAVVASFKDITAEEKARKQVLQSEGLFRSFMGNSPSLAWVYDANGILVYANPLFTESIAPGQELKGKHMRDFTRPELMALLEARNAEVLRSGNAMITEDQICMGDGTEKYFLSNWFPVQGPGGLMVGGQAIDITSAKTAEKNLALMHERFTYVVNASSDAIWDLDLRTGTIYRSDAFTSISGYERNVETDNLDWWMQKIHPDDRRRVDAKIESLMQSGVSQWEDEYRFLHADGSYRYIHDKGYTIFEDNIPVRQVGSMQDITERKNLEYRLTQEEVQKQKLVSQATIQAQEHERNAISGELHDNVNQLLISSKLFIGMARKSPDQQDELLGKASDYLLMAVEEIRALSKRMNSKVVGIVGLKESIEEIAQNMQKHREMEVVLDIDETLTKSLDPQYQLMLFRIVQEQSGNIIKHAEASLVKISIQKSLGDFILRISDNGKGFDLQGHDKIKGIGLLNIRNRVDAYNGRLMIETATGKGCTLEIRFHVTVNPEDNTPS